MDKEHAVHTYRRILLIHKKKEAMPSAATCMDLQIIMPSEVSQVGQAQYDITCVESKIMIQVNFFAEQNKTH